MISKWVCKEGKGDKHAISGKIRVRKLGKQRVITKKQGDKIQECINNSRPKKHNIKSALWSRKSINASLSIRGTNFTRQLYRIA